jgi:peptidoglycan/LPS O-acetylase OafA/YrhL
MKHYPGLDSIRAIAVVLVLIWHLMPPGSFINSLSLGVLGVTIFFVLSGFLITKILLESKTHGQVSKISNTAILKNFYVRRTLRIFPIYYLSILLIVLYKSFIDSNLQFDFLSSLTYTSNFYFYNTGHWHVASHFWTLAVEEQFYLVWPIIILFVDKKYSLHVIILFIVIGIATQLMVDKTGYAFVLPNACFSAFGIGALLSWIIVYQPHLLCRKSFNVLQILALASIVARLAGLHTKEIFDKFPIRMMDSVIGLWMIATVIFSERKGKFFSSAIYRNRLLVFVGKISYGIYLYHIYFRYSGHFFGHFNKHLPFITNIYNPYLLFIEYVCTIILLSWISFKLIEQPFLNLKKYFFIPTKISA